MTHLDKHVSALVDGELGHEARDRALAHVAHCAPCRNLLASERALKERLSSASLPEMSGQLVNDLVALADLPLPARNPSSPAPLLPGLPPPARHGRRPQRGGRADMRRPGGAHTHSRRRVTYAAAGVLSAGVLLLGTAFAAGGSTASGEVAVIPSGSELAGEHAATTSGIPLRDPAFDAVTASFGGLTVIPAASP